MGEQERSLEIARFQAQLGGMKPVHHEGLGDGRSFELQRGLGRPVTVEVFPETQVVRILSPLADLTLRGAHIREPDLDDGLWINGEVDDEWVSTRLSQDGAVIFTSIPKTDQLLRPSPSAIPPLPTGEEPVTPWQPPAPEESGEKPKRLQLTGRVGKEPRFTVAKNGKTLCTFELGVRDEDDQEQPVWHTIQVYDERAEALKGTLHRGQDVFVVGYPRSWTGKDPRTGKEKEYQSITAAVVKPAKAKSEELDRTAATDEVAE